MLRLRLAILLALAVVLTACGASGGGSSAGPTAAASGGSTSTSATPGDTSSDTPDQSEAAATTAPAKTPKPTVKPSGAPSSAEPSGGTTPSPVSTAADACTGTAKNREFFVDTASAVSWQVLCAVLPKGWFVSTGSYRLANGGKMLIAYKGPSGATIQLSEGAFCQAAGGCVPAGTDGGDAAVGPMAGTLVTLDGGGFAIVADRGAPLSWMLEAHGIDEATTRAFGAALAEVAG